MTNQRRFRSRSGFTLTEIMVAITVIAILAGMLMAAVIPAMSSARRTAILMEMKQIEQSIENFKTHHGFYPPSWVRIRNSANPPTALLNYINRLAPTKPQPNRNQTRLLFRIRFVASNRVKRTLPTKKAKLQSITLQYSNLQVQSTL